MSTSNSTGDHEEIRRWAEARGAVPAFLEKFDENNPELLYQGNAADGEKSNFNKLIPPDPISSSKYGEGQVSLLSVPANSRAQAESHLFA